MRRRRRSSLDILLGRRLDRADSQLEERYLSVGEVVLRNRKIRPPEFYKKRRQTSEELVSQRRRELAAAMGDGVSESFLDVFSGTVPAADQLAPTDQREEDLFAAFGDAAAISNAEADVFGHGVFEVSEIETSGKLLPFAKAYKYTKPANWKTEDDVVFYQALRAFGIDLFLIGSILKKYNASEIKRKLKHEMRVNPDLIDEALQCGKQLTATSFTKVNGPIDASKHFDMNTLFDKSPPPELRRRRTKQLISNEERKPKSTNVFDNLFGSGPKNEAAKNESEGILAADDVISPEDLNDLFG
eukprot:Gregarina_sp_Poly_1__10651@NODE_7_length_24424_cov_76_286365_g6_i0_p9_GENE_NODE_7_length_24424_cov_76_286365_g6_i0NODE_7_length_24424_cov_76_286365_g6_i0_p9_ORF_typecomplete_len301_score64_64Myb_DNAbind_7/PF15963_5/8e15Myb_DNAbind_7/PF15963_5/1_3e04Nit_Regul_Hom/PF10126_9/0_15_NODE_7_length_24424_cov_76_286365_g6_i038824784